MSAIFRLFFKIITMQIKNIQQFRTQWRDEQGYQMSNWDEHFIGSNYGDKSGFYKMVNGIVENIKADLTPKLQNAQDEQAIYEFLQNAADSRSTECAVIYDEEYFMVLNNGAPFTEKDLKALLNSFQGTKADKSKAENCDKIGRYGIGFKLAYRLMGKSDGAEELVRDLAGPLLFSWHNPQQMKDLLQHDAAQSLELKGATAADTAPWLLKIILACFPCAPDESVKNLDYQDRVLFPAEEVGELVRFLQKHQALLQNLSLQQGSLFFLKFGPKKHEKLRESLLNIQSGIGYSMNTLKTLQKVILQEVVVERYPVDIERFSIAPGSDDFKRIDPEFPTCPIDIALGFPQTTEQSLALKTAPSVYQFFPMRNERHSLAFFIHGTSFAKITDRTRLDDQGEANIETLKYLATALRRHLTKYKADNFDRYALIYKALLLSDRSKEYDAALLNKHLYDPLLQFIQSNIPTRKRNTFPKELVVLKGTQLPIEPMSFGIGKEWFYWTDDETLLKDAANNAKLGLRYWTLRDLLLEGNASLINAWLEDAEESDYQIFISELREIELDAAFLPKLREIKCFKFADNQGNRRFYALDDLRQAENLFLMSERTAAIRPEIKALGFSVLEFDMLDYSGILKQLETQLDYLTNDKTLFAKIAARTASASLSPLQKHRLFQFLQSLKGVSSDDLRQVLLFSNRQGKACKLQGLLAASVEVPTWLEGYRIAESEDTLDLQDFLVAANLWEAYTHIILPNWAEIAQQSDIQRDGEALLAFYKKVVELSALRPLQPKLTALACVYTDAEQGFLPPSQLFYHKALATIPSYAALRSALQKTLQLPIPAQEILAFLPNDPFKIAETTGEKDWKNRLTDWLQRCQTETLTPEEKRAVFALLRQLLAPKDWMGLKLFCNQKQQREPITKLLPSTAAVEPWLLDYTVAAAEEDAELASLLVKEADIFVQLFLNDWAHLTQHPSVKKDILAFYESVLRYAALSKTPKPLTALRYVYVDETVGFVSATELFYHPALVQMEDYKSFRTGVRALTRLHTPHPAVLPFLQEAILKTKETPLAKAIAVDQATLNKEELTAILTFMNASNEDFFQVLCIEEQANNPREYSVTRRTSKTAQVYLDKSQQKVAEKIRAAYAAQYKLLPHKLYFAEHRNKGLLTAAQLFEQLSKAKDAPADLLSAMLSESGNNELQQQVFSKIDKIVLKQGTVYGKDSFEHQALQLFRNKDADYGQVRSKIWVETSEGQSYRLSDIAFEPTLTFSIDRFGKYTLDLAAVLPRFGELQALLDAIFNQIQDFEAPTLLKRRCFEYQERPGKDVFAELRRDFLQLQQSAQLAFVLLFAKEANNEKLVRDFQVKNVDGQFVPLGQFELFHWQEQPFIEHHALLDKDAYAGVEELLRLNDKRPSLEFGAQRLVLEPYFDKQKFYCVPVRALQEGEALEALQQQILDFAYAKWAALESAARPVRIDFYANADGTILGLDFESLVYPHSYALEQERLPDWLLRWLGKDEEQGAWQMAAEAVANADAEVVTAPAKVWIPAGKLGFLYALGLNTSQSELVQLRRYLSKNEGEPTSQRQLNDLRNRDKQYLEKTILWLQQQRVLFNSADERIVWLRKLYNALDPLPLHLPVPHIHQTKNNDEVLIYQLDSAQECTLFGFDAKQQAQWKERHNLSIQQLLDAVQVTGNRLTNLEIKGLEMVPARVEEELNVEQLQAESKEWATAHYLKWKQDAPYRVYLYPRRMPYRLRFLSATIKNYEQQDAVLCENMAYVNLQAANVEEELFKIAKNASLSEQLLLQLLRYKNEAVRETGHAVIERVVEKVVEQVVVEDRVEQDEELIESPTLEVLKNCKTKPYSRLKLAFDLSDVPEEMLEPLLQYAAKAKVIVKK